jgi:hypothetical protein
VTICATIAACLLILRLARSSGATVGASLIASLAFLMSPLLEPWGFEFRVDVPALAFELGGIALFQAGFAYASLPLLAAAFFIKQTRVAGILALALYLWLNGDNKRALVLSTIWVVEILVVTGILQYVYPYYWTNSFEAQVRLYDFSAMPRMIAGLVMTELPVLALAAYSVCIGPRWSVAICYLLVAIVEDTILSMHWGSNVSYLLPAMAGACVVAAPALDYFLEQIHAFRMPAQLLAGAVLAWALGSQTWLGHRLGGEIGWPLDIKTFWLDAQCDCGDSRLWNEQMLARMHSMKGPVLSDISELVVMNAAPRIQFVDLIPLSAMKATGRFDDRALISAVEHREFDAIVLDKGLLREQWRGRRWFWPELADAIARNYQLVPPSGPPPYLALPVSGPRQ